LFYIIVTQTTDFKPILAAFEPYRRYGIAQLKTLKFGGCPA
jgi:hypothetical protein